MPSFVSPKSSKKGYLGGLLAKNRQNMGVCYSSVSELSYSDAGSCTVAASGMSELIGVELVRQGNRIPSLEGLGLNGDNAPKRFRRPHDKSWAHLARPGLQLAEVLSQGGESGALLSTRGALSARSGSGAADRVEGAPEGPRGA